METILHYLDLFGVAVFAITGALAAGRKRMDVLGVVVLATVTALGGGTIRDLVLGVAPVFWVSAPVYVLMAAATAIVVFFLVRFYELPQKVLSVADAFGLAVFTVLGTQKALALGTNAGIAIVMGVMTGAAGGIVRDMLSGEIPLILRREIYATASLCGAFAYWLTLLALNNQGVAVLVSVVVTLGLRLPAIKWNLSLPHYVSRQQRLSPRENDKSGNGSV